MRHFHVVFEFPSALFQNLLSKRCRNVIKRELNFYFHPAVELILRCSWKRSLFVILIGRRDAALRYDWCRSRRFPKFPAGGRMALSWVGGAQQKCRRPSRKTGRGFYTLPGQYLRPAATNQRPAFCLLQMEPVKPSGAIRLVNFVLVYHTLYPSES